MGASITHRERTDSPGRGRCERPWVCVTVLIFLAPHALGLACGATHRATGRVPAKTKHETLVCKACHGHHTVTNESKYCNNIEIMHALNGLPM